MLASETSSLGQAGRAGEDGGVEVSRADWNDTIDPHSLPSPSSSLCPPLVGPGPCLGIQLDVTSGCVDGGGCPTPDHTGFGGCVDSGSCPIPDHTGFGVCVDSGSCSAPGHIGFGWSTRAGGGNVGNNRPAIRPPNVVSLPVDAPHTDDNAQFPPPVF